ncbi:hypothetical protein AMECASPLE_019385 [Ameca splendens]|uniref:Uncharacterized protein n=1 Tax=Ameca splendens TaxID=208324 RepID=A0ABV0YF29_9TELE
MVGYDLFMQGDISPSDSSVNSFHQLSHFLPAALQPHWSLSSALFLSLFEHFQSATENFSKTSLYRFLALVFLKRFNLIVLQIICSFLFVCLIYQNQTSLFMSIFTLVSCCCEWTVFLHVVGYIFVLYLCPFIHPCIVFVCFSVSLCCCQLFLKHSSVICLRLCPFLFFLLYCSSSGVGCASAGRFILLFFLGEHSFSS